MGTRPQNVYESIKVNGLFLQIKEKYGGKIFNILKL